MNRAVLDTDVIVSGITFVIRNGLRSCDALAAYGPHKTIYTRFIRWSRLDVFNRISAVLAARGGKPDQLMSVRSHQSHHPHHQPRRGNLAAGPRTGPFGCMAG